MAAAVGHLLLPLYSVHLRPQRSETIPLVPEQNLLVRVVPHKRPPAGKLTSILLSRQTKPLTGSVTGLDPLGESEIRAKGFAKCSCAVGWVRCRGVSQPKEEGDERLCDLELPRSVLVGEIKLTLTIQSDIRVSMKRSE